MNREMEELKRLFLKQQRGGGADIIDLFEIKAADAQDEVRDDASSGQDSISRNIKDAEDR